MANNAVTAQPQGQAISPMKAFNQLITSDGMQKYIGDVLGAKKQQFTNNVVALMASSKLLQGCNPMSVIYAALKATALDLPFDPALGMAYVIPYNNKDGAVAQFQIGKAGLIQLAMRSGQIKRLNAGTLVEGDTVEEDFLTGELTIAKGKVRNEKNIIGFFAYLETSNFKKTIFMSKAEMDAHGKRFSKSFNSGPWSTDYESMAHKTMLKKILKWAPMSVDLQTATTYDQAAILDQDGAPTYVDNYSPDEQEQMAIEANTAAVNEQKANMKAEGKTPTEMP